MEMVQRSGPVTAIIPAGGSGARFSRTRPKQFVQLGRWPVLAHTLSRFDQTNAVDRVVVVVPRGRKTFVRSEIVKRFGFQNKIEIVVGGEHRQDSVYNGFMALDEDVELVLIHDAVRPLVSIKLIEEVIEAGRMYGAAIAAVPVKDTLKKVQNGTIVDTLDRVSLWQAQTPQVFDRTWLAEALTAARRDGILATDEAALIERCGYPVRVVHGALANLKITSPEDLVLAESLIGYDSMDSRMRVGTGYDVHALVSGRRLVLGGLEIPYNLGLDGHSDADVIIHALCDALLGAAGLPDIGANFPDTDPQWAGVGSLELLELVGEKIRSAGFDLVNADLTLMAEKPKIKNYVPEMGRLMAEALSTEPDLLNIKGTTTEGLGLVGRGEGMAASAVVLLSRKSEW